RSPVLDRGKDCGGYHIAPACLCRTPGRGGGNVLPFEESVTFEGLSTNEFVKVDVFSACGGWGIWGVWGN
ncbi:MAG: hypothetical protein ACKO3P_12225, partial [Planctomycetaceae bacterium]